MLRCECNFEPRKLIESGIIVGIVFLVLNFLIGIATGSMYTKPELLHLWKPMTGSWWLWMAISDIIVGIIFAGIYGVVKDSIKCEGIRKGICFGTGVWLIGTLPGMAMTYLTMAVPTSLVAVWAITGFIVYVIGGIVLSIIYEKFE